MSQPKASSHRFRRALAAAAALALAGMGAVAGSTAAAADDTAAEPKLAVYVEVNSNDLANVADYTLADSGLPAVDLAMIFAANINYDGEKAYLHFNERVTETLQDAQNQIRPLQARGTKVLLSVLGNHQGAGFANFTSFAAADAFAAQLADAVTTYGLDGIDFDDEWTNYGANGTPQPNAQSFGWLASALRDRLGPDKLITLYAIGETYTVTDFTRFDAAAVIDHAWNPYYPSYNAPTVPGLEDRARLGAAAVDLSNVSSATAADYARRTVSDGYGVYVAYNLTATDQSGLLSGITQALKGEATEYRAAP
ncbi:endo-beta-N-acetylglucosaminidase H [Microbacterium sp. 2RAF4]|uniref:endo-beta-N-acetylglucosaminidase H n=1 Tax=Microbacterium sp. 2RAF4 TaxID=3232999 RepID=UPI003F972D84